MQITYCELTDRGLTRENNEDTLLASVPSTPELLKEKGALFIIADGLGGLEKGEVASKTAAAHIADVYSKLPKLEGGGWMVAAFRDANKEIYKLGAEVGGEGSMGTTLTASWFRLGKLITAHVGDCRLYRLRGKEIARLTRDHNISRHILARAVGTEPELEVDLFESQIQAGDVYLHASDGLHSLVEDDEIAPLLKSADLPDASKKLIRMANERGGPDNISVQIVRVSEA